MLKKSGKNLKRSLLFLMVLVIGLTMIACSEKDDDPAASSTSDTPYDYDLTPYVTLGKYKGVEISKYDAVEVTDDEVQNEIDYTLYMNSSDEQIYEGTVAEGDTVNINYVGRIDGELFDGGSFDGYNLIIGSGSLIPGFETGLIGKNIGETVTLNLTFPEDYNDAELIGKDVVFEATLNYIVLYSEPEFTDEFVKEITDSQYNTTAEYEQYIRDLIFEYKQSQTDEQKKTEIWENIMNGVTFIKLPQVEIDKYKNNEIAAVEEAAAASGMTVDDYLVTNFEMTYESFLDEVAIYAEDIVKEDLIFYSIVKAENLSVSDAEYKEGLDYYYNNMYHSFSTVEEFEAYYTKEIILETVLWNEMLDMLLANAVETSVAAAG